MPNPETMDDRFYKRFTHNSDVGWCPTEVVQFIHSELERTKQELKAEFVGELRKVIENRSYEDGIHPDSLDYLIKKYE